MSQPDRQRAGEFEANAEDIRSLGAIAQFAVNLFRAGKIPFDAMSWGVNQLLILQTRIMHRTNAAAGDPNQSPAKAAQDENVI